MKISLDHLGVVSAADQGLRAVYRRLGFDVTEPDELMASDATGSHLPLGQRSCHAVMQCGYIELSEVYSSDPSHHLARYLQRGSGLHILALGSDDIAAALTQCSSAGIACSEVRWATRDIAYGERRGPAHFEWFMVAPEDAPEGLVCVVRNHTPELLYQPQVMQHANGAVALRGVVVASDDVEAAAARYARITGAAVERAGPDRKLRLHDGEIVIRPAAAAAVLHGLSRAAASGRFAAQIVAVRDLSATQSWLQSQAVNFETGDGKLRIRAAEAGGAGLVLVPA